MLEILWSYHPLKFFFPLRPWAILAWAFFGRISCKILAPMVYFFVSAQTLKPSKFIIIFQFLQLFLVSCIGESRRCSSSKGNWVVLRFIMDFKFTAVYFCSWIFSTIVRTGSSNPVISQCTREIGIFPIAFNWSKKLFNEKGELFISWFLA